MNDVCYLCGKLISLGQVRSSDHVVPATLITRAQPKARGFDYGGFLPTHETCNNRFGSETYVSKALDLLRVLHSPLSAGPLQHRQHSDISILPIDASLLPNFGARDFKFFNIYDMRDSDIASFSDPTFYVGKTKANPIRNALFTSLSVLAKSAAALLVKRQLGFIPSLWRIYAQVYEGDLSEFDSAETVGGRFDNGLSAHIEELPQGNWHLTYAAKGTLVLFAFAFCGRMQVLRHFVTANMDADTLVFSGANINELMTTGWRQICCGAHAIETG